MDNAIIINDNESNKESEAFTKVIKNDEGDALGTSLPMGKNIIAKMPVSIDSECYNMEHKHRGHAIIFNHKTFNVSQLKERHGTDVDGNNLENILKNLGFKVAICHDYKFKDMYKVLEDLASMDHTDNDCIIVSILSHGEMGTIYAKDTPYKLDSLLGMFTADRCPTLAGKPKIFFIQACQGDQLDEGVTLSNRTETDGSAYSYRIPSQADFLIAYSTIPGYYSWRNTTNGSWFMQALCNELQLNGKTRDLLTLLTFVCRRVATDFESNTPDSIIMHRKKQIPCITSMLTRLVFFPKKLHGQKLEIKKNPLKMFYNK
ncbi:caspase-1-like [Ctenocephalides felis]|uniref:caspase-1-like n=1 Tax=Ctenocephalides felis TaxID=7515 RepID=UPI000E6E1743|nr:caspase-1-like [Ctenocephalides felis]